MIISGPLLRRAGVAGALLCIGLLACKPGDTPSSAPPPSHLEVETSWGTFYVVVTPQPDPIPLNKMFALTIAVHPASNHAETAGDTTVAVDARMPAHSHGMNLQPRVAPLGDGRFRAEGMLFHMPGTWELYVDVTRAAEMERATFVINVD